MNCGIFAGSSLTLHIIGTDRELYNVKLGKNIDTEEKFLAAVKSGSWFAASVDEYHFLFVSWLYRFSWI